MFGSRVRIAGPRRRTDWRGLVALLLLFLPVAIFPRTSIVVHDHAGGSRAHVHVADAPTGHDHGHDYVSDLLDEHRHAAEHHHHHDNVHGHVHHHHHGADHDGAAAHGGALAALHDHHASATHWHAQNPYLLSLPSARQPGIVLFSTPSSAAEIPPAPPTGLLALPFARGPPSAPSIPTFRVS